MSRIRKIDYSTNYKKIPLKEEIAKLKNPTKESVKELYGSFGLDVYENKSHLTILSQRELKKSKSIIYKIKKWFFGSSIYDFQENDTLKDVVFKYAGNKEAGLIKDIETMFGKKGMESFESLRRLGYVIV